jgi:hypothetical protein
MYVYIAGELLSVARNEFGSTGLLVWNRCPEDWNRG